MGMDFIILMTMFIVACAYFNHKSGYKQGIIDGADSTLKLLEATGYIKVVEDDATGESEIKKVTDGNNT